MKSKNRCPWWAVRVIISSRTTLGNRPFRKTAGLRASTCSSTARPSGITRWFARIMSILMKPHAELRVLVPAARGRKLGRSRAASKLLSVEAAMPVLPRKGLLAIAAVIDVALHEGHQPVVAKALAHRHRLPPRHLEPVLQALVRQGVLKGIRGPRGGYQLGREPRRITAEDVLRAIGTAEDEHEGPGAKS